MAAMMPREPAEGKRGRSVHGGYSEVRGGGRKTSNGIGKLLVKSIKDIKSIIFFR